jgi:uncharacterized protein (TIGR00266 family)
LEYTIQSQPSYSLLEVTLDENDSLAAESGAMAWMSDNIRMTTSTRGGVLTGIRRSVLGGESFFQNTYHSEGGQGKLGLAPGQPGDIVAHDMRGTDLYLEKNAFLASDVNVSIDSKFEGLRGLFNEGLFILRASGRGKLFFNSYGDVQEIEVDGSYIVDNSHAVAWEPTLDYRITRGRKIRSFLFSDQLLLRFSGRGRLWVQSRNPQALANWVNPFRSTASSSGGGE